jgi:thioredoxin reductase (NADPH)
MTDVIIVGGGPAGLTAAIYTSRAGLSTVVLERQLLGGQAALTYEIDNYPGFKNITGVQLATELENHVRAAGAEIQYADVISFDLSNTVKVIKTSTGTLEARAVILAQGCERRKLGVPGEQEYNGRGVSYCATCDGNFFRGRDVVVIGGGNTAVGDAIALAKLCRHVTLIHYRDKLSSMYSLRNQLDILPNVTVMLNHRVTELLGNGVLEQLRVEDVSSGEQQFLAVSGIFIAIGMVPNTKTLEGVLPLNNGFIKAEDSGVTDIPGVFVAGDIRQKQLHQIVTAMSDGANAAYSAQLYLQNQA